MTSGSRRVAVLKQKAALTASEFADCSRKFRGSEAAEGEAMKSLQNRRKLQLQNPKVSINICEPVELPERYMDCSAPSL